MTPTCDLHILQKKSHLNIDFCGSVTSKTPRRFMKSRYFCTKLSAGSPGCDLLVFKAVYIGIFFGGFESGIHFV